MHMACWYNLFPFTQRQSFNVSLATKRLQKKKPNRRNKIFKKGIEKRAYYYYYYSKSGIFPKNFLIASKVASFIVFSLLCFFGRRRQTSRRIVLKNKQSLSIRIKAGTLFWFVCFFTVHRI